MSLKGLGIAMGVGAAVGAVAIMMTPKNCTVRKFADKAADKVEDAAMMVGDMISDKMDKMM